MSAWYKTYWNQNWYPNTFLVHRPAQIARSVRRRREWNNIAKVGCNLTCLAMILGIDPARLAGTLAGKKRFFVPDQRTPAARLDHRRGFFVWDRNRPNRDRKQVRLRLWHPPQGMVNARIRFVESHFPGDLQETEAMIRAIHARGHHAIWGTEKHASLVAGKGRDGYFLWDPNVRDIDKTMHGGLTLAKRFPKRTPTEICEYDVRLET
jgi:hypothetical protein